MDPAVPRVSRRRRRSWMWGLLALPLAGAAWVLPAVVANSSDVGTAARTSVGRPVDNRSIDAFTASGYSVDDAAVLARRWGGSMDPYQVQAAAGWYLERGVGLADSPWADPVADDATPELLTDLFLGLGYGARDAAVLAERWGVDVDEAMVRAGRELSTVGALPYVDADVVDDACGDPDACVQAFSAAGLDEDDARELAGFWGLGDARDATLRAGSLLLAGEPLPAMAGLGG